MGESLLVVITVARFLTLGQGELGRVEEERVLYLVLGLNSRSAQVKLGCFWASLNCCLRAAFWDAGVSMSRRDVGLWLL